MKKFCPLTKSDCKENECAWYAKQEEDNYKACAIYIIPFALAESLKEQSHISDNIEYGASTIDRLAAKYLEE